MQEDRFEQLLRDASQSYNIPPTADAEAMWSAIEAEHFGAQDAKVIQHRRAWYTSSWLRVAAALVTGVGIGRVSIDSPVAHSDAQVHTAITDSVAPLQSASVMNDPATLRYIGQTVALLASFESDIEIPRTDTAVAARAKDLLLTTRLLLDSQQNSDPIVTALLEDLELVLVQIVQMPPKRNASDVDLIKEAMQQRDVMPRLIAAATNTTSAE